MNSFNSNPTDVPSALHAERERLIKSWLTFWKDWAEEEKMKNKIGEEGGKFVRNSFETLKTEKVASPNEEASGEDRNPESKKENS